MAQQYRAIVIGCGAVGAATTYWLSPKFAQFTPERFGIYGYLADDGLYYGFPIYGEVATKIGIDGAGPVVTPQTRTFAPDEARQC